MRSLALTCAFFVATLAAIPAQAQSVGSSSEAAPLWEVHLHLQKSFASPLGQRIMEMFKADKPEDFDNFVKFAEAIGLDPRTDIGEVVLFGDGFDEDDVTVIASLGQSTGNLEGWILAAPGYRSDDLDDSTQLHSMTVEGKNVRAWFALPKHAQSGNYTLVGSLDRDRTVNLAEKVLAGSVPVPNPLDGERIFSFIVHDLSQVPIEIDDDQPGSAIVKTVEAIGLNIASNSNNLSLALDISANSASKARQISQLLTGIKAFVQLAPIEEPEAKKMAEVLDALVVEHTEGQTAVHASLSAPYELLEDFLHELN